MQQRFVVLVFVVACGKTPHHPLGIDASADAPVDMTGACLGQPGDDVQCTGTLSGDVTCIHGTFDATLVRTATQGQIMLHADF